MSIIPRIASLALGALLAATSTTTSGAVGELDPRFGVHGQVAVVGMDNAAGAWQEPDGSIVVSDDAGSRIWRVSR